MVQIGTDISIAEALLREGKLVAIPTETVYGLAANGLNADAVLGIYKTKNRPHFNPLILHSYSLAIFENAGVQINAMARKLAEAAFPGPLSIVLPHDGSKIPDIVCAGLPTVAIRIPNHPVSLELLRKLPFPLAAPSANPSNYISPTTAQHVADQLGNSLDYILDGGACHVGVESTIVSLVDNTPRLLRYGGFPPGQIESILGIPLLRNETPEKINAPGMLQKHYSPRKPMRIGIQSHISGYAPSRIGILCRQNTWDNIPLEQQFILSEDGHLDTIAQRLFEGMRYLDQLDIDVILMDEVENIGIGYAINDRIRRASFDS